MPVGAERKDGLQCRPDDSLPTPAPALELNWPGSVDFGGWKWWSLFS